MKGENDLGLLIRNMKPRQVPGEYVFCSIDDEDIILIETPLLIFREDEGLTVVITRAAAESLKFKFESTWGLITLTIHSDLTAVGFLARISQYLAQAGVSVNFVSAYYHDHLFVPYTEVKRTLKLLKDLSNESSD